MDNADYLDIALRLANANLDGLDELRATLHDEPWWADRVTERDLRALRQGCRPGTGCPMENPRRTGTCTSRTRTRHQPPRSRPPRPGGSRRAWCATACAGGGAVPPMTVPASSWTRRRIAPSGSVRRAAPTGYTSRRSAPDAAADPRDPRRVHRCPDSPLDGGSAASDGATRPGVLAIRSCAESCKYRIEQPRGQRTRGGARIPRS